MKILMVDALGALGLAMYDLCLCGPLAAIPGAELILEVPGCYPFASSEYRTNRHSRHMDRDLGRFRRTWEYARWLGNMSQNAIRFRPQIIHWQTPLFPFMDLVINYYVKKFINPVKFVVTIHEANCAYLTLNNAIGRKSFMQRADGIICHSQEAEEEYRSWLKNIRKETKFKVIPIGPSPRPETAKLIPQEIREHFNIKPESAIIISVGCINQRKDYKESLMLISELQKIYPAIDYIIAGSSSGGDIAEIELLKAKVARPENIHIIHRYLSELEVDMLHSIADFSLLLYKTSVSSAAAVRSLCAGVPVICNDKPGFRSIIKDGLNGLVLSGESLQDAAKRIYAILQNGVSLKKMKENALATYQGITWEQVALMHYSFYQEVLVNY